ncbi:MAG: tyrosine-type recombinase/integrase [Bacteroidetes bacterium]|nr:tyrosine-type recombinase/integrase [Bacteroidota bacterium]
MKKVELVPAPGQLSITLPLAVTKRTKEFVQSSEKKNTTAAYDQARTRWPDYLGYRGIEPIDATDGTVADFLIVLHDGGLAPNTISLSLAVVRSDCRKLGLDLTGEITQKTIRNIREKGRSRGRGQAKGAGIESVHLVSRKLASDGSLRSLRDAVILLVMSDAMLRGSELLQPRVGHISEESDKSGRLELTFTTKTIKKGDAVQYLGASTMRIVNEYIKMVGLTEGDKLVVGIDRWDRPSSKDISMRALNKIVPRLGQDHFGEHLSSHSFRVGSAQTLSSKGATLPELQTVGRWKSSKMPAHYCRKQFAGRNAMAKYIYG